MEQKLSLLLGRLRATLSVVFCIARNQIRTKYYTDRLQVYKFQCLLYIPYVRYTYYLA
jgi:hypothetical protein